MSRRIVVDVLASLIVLLLAGASLAATAQLPDEAQVDTRAQEVLEGALPGEDGPPAPPVELPAQATQDPGAEEPADVEVQQVEDPATLDDDGDGFGVERSAEVRTFGECMDAVEEGDHEARAACFEHKPGPAYQNPAHPRYNDGDPPGHARSAEARAAAPGQERSAEAREGRGGPPAHAGGGKPDHAGGPSDS